MVVFVRVKNVQKKDPHEEKKDPHEAGLVLVDAVLVSLRRCIVPASG